MPVLLPVTLPVLISGQTPATTASSHPRPELSSHPDWPKGSQADHAGPEAVVKAFFSAISTPAGGKLDQERLRSLFTPAGRIAVGLAPRPGHAADVVYLTPEQYAASSDEQTVTSGFYDRNLANQTEHFGVMAHVYAAYESREHEVDVKPLARGVKSFELLHSGDRWYILEVYWDSERPDNPIPDRYLHNHDN